MADAQKERQRALEEAVSRAVRDNLIPLQRSLDDLQQAYADLVSACSSARPSNALPAMLRAQATSASLAATLSVLSNFITGIMQQHDRGFSGLETAEPVRASSAEVAPPAKEAPRRGRPSPRVGDAETAQDAAEPEAPVEAPVSGPAVHQTSHFPTPSVEETDYVNEALPEGSQATPAEEIASEPVVEGPAPFDVASLPSGEQELHKRANRVAKVSMQDIKMLKPEEVRKGCENKDICIRLRSELDKARKEYDRRFQKILDHPVDYFHHWLVEVLGNGDPETIGEYPYPSPVLRH